MLNIFGGKKSEWKKQLKANLYDFTERRRKVTKIILYLVAKETFLVFSFLVSFCVKESFLYSWSFNGNDLNNSKNKSRKNTKYVFIVNLRVYILVSALKHKMENYDCILHGNEAFTFFHEKFNINSILLFRVNNTNIYINVINI